MHVAGNLIATRDDKRVIKQPITSNCLWVSTSETKVDCVPNGGHYDGQIGVLGAIEIIETLVENDFQTNHPLELIVFSNEESGVFGSRAFDGRSAYRSVVKCDDTFGVYQCARNGTTERLEGGGDAKKILSIARNLL